MMYMEENVLAEKANVVMRSEIARFEEDEWEVITGGTSFLVNREMENGMYYSICVLQKDGLVGESIQFSRTRFIMDLLLRTVDRTATVIGL